MTLPGEFTGSFMLPAAGHLGNRDEQAAASHDSADSALKEKCTYTLWDAGQPGHPPAATVASQQEQSQSLTKLQGSGGGGGAAGGRPRLTLTLIFWPWSQWSHLVLPCRWHEKYSMPGCKTTAR